MQASKSVRHSKSAWTPSPAVADGPVAFVLSASGSCGTSLIADASGSTTVIENTGAEATGGRPALNANPPPMPPRRSAGNPPPMPPMPPPIPPMPPPIPPMPPPISPPLGPVSSSNTLAWICSKRDPVPTPTESASEAAGDLEKKGAAALAASISATTRRRKSERQAPTCFMCVSRRSSAARDVP